MTDPKGDRSAGPGKQADPDLFLHVVERRDDGVVLRGAKAHQTGCINSHWIVVMPTMRMREADRDYAVVAAIPVDHPGLSYVYGRQSCDSRAQEGRSIRATPSLPGRRRSSSSTMCSCPTNTSSLMESSSTRHRWWTGSPDFTVAPTSVRPDWEMSSSVPPPTGRMERCRRPEPYPRQACGDGAPERDRVRRRDRRLPPVDPDRGREFRADHCWPTCVSTMSPASPTSWPASPRTSAEA